MIEFKCVRWKNFVSYGDAQTEVVFNTNKATLVIGDNGAGKSTLMKIMAGLDTDFSGEAWSAEGAKVGYLPQEPELDSSKNVRENVMLGVAPKKEILDRYNDLAMNYSDETADEMAKLQDQIDAENLWDLDSQIDVSMEALRCPFCHCRILMGMKV